ncbi:MAG: sulfite exporter TauE/SafE family protein [Candidatus Eisenbacteria bacterium]|uniref:Probable membrane transporter protein n=1 Tax=Eiseniibacteriota bacterium TaxID=2212470 RepID=A0A538TAA7_UNCEI|nr:MAG: sulfite exporter TauE/SafE family protein [Candidatus Eisenbacteria bacterium]
MRTSVMPFVFGLLAGALGGLMGVGGGILLVPLLVHLVHVEQHEAQGTSLAFITVTALVAAIPYFLQGNLDFALALYLAVGAVPGVLAGAALARKLTARKLRQAFGILILATAVRILVAAPSHADAHRVWAPPWNILLGAVVGALGGLLGVGGGTILVPILVLGQRIPQHVAQGVSLLMILPTGIVGALSHARHGHVVRALLPGLMAGGAAGALLGALLAHRIEASFLSRLFALFLVPVSAQMIFGRRRDNVPCPSERSGGSLQ